MAPRVYFKSDFNTHTKKKNPENAFSDCFYESFILKSSPVSGNICAGQSQPSKYTQPHSEVNGRSTAVMLQSNLNLYPFFRYHCHHSASLQCAARFSATKNSHSRIRAHLGSGCNQLAPLQQTQSSILLCVLLAATVGHCQGSLGVWEVFSQCLCTP